METILIGMLGFLIALALFCGGGVCGYFLCKKLIVAKNTSSIEALSKQEEERIRQERLAFDQLMNYSADVAYGIGQKRVKEVKTDG